MTHSKQPVIGKLREAPLHAALKERYAIDCAQMEVPVDGYVVDVKCGDLLVEIQTGNFSAIKSKLQTLVARHRVRLVYPVAVEKWIVKLPMNVGEQRTRRKSPKRGRVHDVFEELVSFPTLLLHNNFSLEVLLTREEEIRCYNGKKTWRNGGWVRQERRLLDIAGSHMVEGPIDLSALLPPKLQQPFTTADLAVELRITRRLAQKMAYCFRELELLQKVGNRKRSYLYEIGTVHPGKENQ